MPSLLLSALDSSSTVRESRPTSTQVAGGVMSSARVCGWSTRMLLSTSYTARPPVAGCSPGACAGCGSAQSERHIHDEVLLAGNRLAPAQLEEDVARIDALACGDVEHPILESGEHPGQATDDGDGVDRGWGWHQLPLGDVRRVQQPVQVDSCPEPQPFEDWHQDLKLDVAGTSAEASSAGIQDVGARLGRCYGVRHGHAEVIVPVEHHRHIDGGPHGCDALRDVR